MSATGNAAGFTLIEVLVTLGIAALVAGLVFPAIERTIGDWQYRQAQVAVRVGLLRAREAAMRGDRTVAFAVTDDGAGYRIGDAEPVRLPGAVRFVGDARATAFYADGSTSGGRFAIAGARSVQRAAWAIRETGLIGAGQ